MKAIILAAGFGTRLRPYTHSGPKQMLPIANKPVLEYCIQKVRTAGIREIAMVVGYMENDIMKYFGNGSDFDLSIQYFEQKQRLGLAHAVSICKEFLDEPFVMLLGDVLFQTNLRDILLHHETEKNTATVALTEVSNPEAFGVAKTEGNQIAYLVEKPVKPPSNLIIAGVYVFENPAQLFDIIDQLPPSKRNEYEITDAIQVLIDQQERVGWYKLESWKDTGRPEDLLAANKMVLNTIKPDLKGIVQGEIVNSAIIGKGSHVKGEIVGPVVIGDFCTIDVPKLGPYVCIGDGCIINGVSLENSIIMENCEIKTPWAMKQAIIGKNCCIESATELESEKFFIGDHSKIKI